MNLPIYNKRSSAPVEDMRVVGNTVLTPMAAENHVLRYKFFVFLKLSGIKSVWRQPISSITFPMVSVSCMLFIVTRSSPD